MVRRSRAARGRSAPGQSMLNIAGRATSRTPRTSTAASDCKSRRRATRVVSFDEGAREASDTLVDLGHAVMREGQAQAMPKAARHRASGAGQETGPGVASGRLERAGIYA